MFNNIPLNRFKIDTNIHKLRDASNYASSFINFQSLKNYID